MYGDPTLYRIGLAISVPVLPISDAVHCNRSCSALQPPLQCTASVLAVHCILHANICNLSRKRLQPPLQTFASAIANVCGEKTPFCGIPSPHVFLLSRFPTVMLWVTLLSEVHLRWYSSVASALPIPQACCAMCAVDFLFHSSPCVV